MSEFPGDVIREEMNERGWDFDRLTTETCPPTQEEWGIRRLSIEMYLALRGADDLMQSVRLGDMADHLAVAFGVEPQFFRNLETSWLLACREYERGRVAGRGEILAMVAKLPSPWKPDMFNQTAYCDWCGIHVALPVAGESEDTVYFSRVPHPDNDCLWAAATRPPEEA